MPGTYVYYFRSTHHFGIRKSGILTNELELKFGQRTGVGLVERVECKSLVPWA
jgi:hypothetical protein